jgi:hypothetical protein
MTGPLSRRLELAYARLTADWQRPAAVNATYAELDELSLLGYADMLIRQKGFYNSNTGDWVGRGSYALFRLGTGVRTVEREIVEG